MHHRGRSYEVLVKSMHDFEEGACNSHKKVQNEVL